MIDKRETFRREQDKEVYKMSKDAYETAGRALATIESHEKVCAERFLRIEGWVNLIFKILGWAGPSLVGLLVAIIFMLLRKP